jgi:hypothetical protein
MIYGAVTKQEHESVGELNVEALITDFPLFCGD